jgi:decaprenylphospho-beta-D-ribofuranose 2-oxidase
MQSEARRLCGWGGISHSEALMIRPLRAEQVPAAVAYASSRGGLIARGAGRSYGDAAQNGGGVVLDASALSEVELLEGPTLRVGAGATLARCLGVLARSGLTLPVLPGTRHITIGGAIAADVHGKNHPHDGSFGHHVQSITLCLADGSLREVSRERESDVFFATIGGMGLTGVIVEARIAPRPLMAPTLDGEVDRTASIERALSVMSREQARRYAITWVDLLSEGATFGRCVVLRCAERPLSGEGADELGEARIALPGRRRLAVPAGFPSGLLRPALVRAFNEAHWRNARRRGSRRQVTFAENFFPLDALGGWSRLYGDGGLVQYQFLVPERRADVLVEIVHALRQARQPMYLAVIKRFGEGSGGMLSFPAAGWTLAIDLPAASRGLSQALDLCDRLLLRAGGRVYLAKDARLDGEHLAAMYPRLARFAEVQASLDPDAVIRSDMSRRLGLARAGGR